jgi:ferredoxin
MKLGVFLCTCDRSIEIDARDIKKALKRDVEIVELQDQLCLQGRDYLIDDIRRMGLDGVLIAACTEKNPIFDRVAAGFGCDTHFLNLRDYCGRVHGRKEATEKAISMIKAALGSMMARETRPLPTKILVDVGYDVLVVGKKETGAFEVAKSLVPLAHVQLLTDTVPEWCDEPVLHFGPLKAIRGEIGKFEVEIERSIDHEKCIACGRCAEACPIDAIQYDAVYSIGGGCDECGECLEVCPTGAIAFHTPEVLQVGQILVLDREWEGSPQFGVYTAENLADALRKTCQLIANLGKLEKERYVTVDLKRCASGRSELLGCEYCLPCPYGAIQREGVKLVFSDAGCLGCGLCASLCPLSVPQLRTYPNRMLYEQLEQLLAADMDMKVVLFACRDNAEKLATVGRRGIPYPPVLPLFVPCIDVIAETHLLAAFERGADGVILWGCPESHPKRLDPAIRFTRKALAAFGLSDRVLVLDDASLEPDDFGKRLTEFVNHLKPSPLRKKRPEPIDFTAPKRAILQQVLGALSQKTGVRPALREESVAYPFAEVVVDASTCTLCNACVTLCPMKALRKSENAIQFRYADCIACGLCEQACPEEAISLHRILDLAELMENGEKKLVEVERITCAGCGVPFMPRVAFERIRTALEQAGDEGEFNLEERLKMLTYCTKCRPVKAVELAMQKAEAEK